MALLRQCLQEVRARHGDRDNHLQNGISQTEWSGKSDSSAGPPSPFQVESFINKVDALAQCSAPFSNPRSTARQ